MDLIISTDYEFTEKWRHIALVLEDDATSIPLYIDGNLVDAFSKTVNTGDAAAVDEFIIGAELDSAGVPAAGTAPWRQGRRLAAKPRGLCPRLTSRHGIAGLRPRAQSSSSAV